jgi:hypothetical protein
MQFRRLLLSKHSVSLGSHDRETTEGNHLDAGAMSKHNSDAESRVYMKRMAAFTHTEAAERTTRKRRKV